MTIEQLLVHGMCSSAIINDHMSEEDIAQLMHKQSDAICKEFGWNKDDEVMPNVNQELVNMICNGK